jgi:predicted metal-dependent hydrolase
MTKRRAPVSNKNMDYRLIRSKRRSIGLQVTTDALLVVRAPNSLNLRKVEEIVHQKASWIKKKQQEMLSFKVLSPSKKFIAGEKFWFLGEQYELQLVSGIKGRVRFQNEKFVMNSNVQPRARVEFENWYKWEAKKYLKSRVAFLAKKFGYKYNQVRITSAKTRWGSCSSKKNLNFSWRLIMVKPEIIDYVIIHELAHLKQMNHSKKFWNLVEKMMPEYKEHRMWLREKGKMYSID